MHHAIVHFFTHFPPPLAAYLMAIFPIAERFALPVAILKFKLPVPLAFVLVVAGNMTPAICILTLADRFQVWVRRHAGFFGKAWVKSVEHAQERFAKYEPYGLAGVYLFMAIPLPFNGAYTASLITFILGYPRRHALPVLFAGILTANVLTLFITLGALHAL